MKKLRRNNRVSLFSTFKDKKQLTKEYVVTTFLAILEISNKLGVKIYQVDTYSDIIIAAV